MIRRWIGCAAVVVAAAVVVVAAVAGGNAIIGVGLAVVMVIFAWLVSPLLAPRGPDWAQAEELARTRNVPLILWKPGCAYCIRLRLALGAAGSRAAWIDIWRDEAAAAATRQINNGNETTPTVVLAEASYTNPEPGFVKALITAR